MSVARRGLLLLVILLSFGRLMWRLDQHNLLFDESLSLQRAEYSWPDIVRGRLTISDGVASVHTTDQHPFGYFALLSLFVRTAGKSEFALRFPAAAAGTLLGPAAWALARRLTRRGALPAGSAAWAVVLVAFAPFFLWYGQEARMYTLTPLLAVVSTYALLRWDEASGRNRSLLAGAYIGSAAALLSTHFFSVFLLPVHGIFIYSSLIRQGRRWALAAAGGLIALGGVIGLAAATIILRQIGAGTNFSAVSPPILVRDLLNAFSLGPGADVSRWLWLDLLFAVLAAAGAVWGLWTRARRAAGGWLLLLWAGLPVILLMIINALQPAYMTARHMSLVSVAFLILVGAGLAWVGSRRLWLAGAIGLVVFGGMAYASYRYYEDSANGTGDLAGMGAYLAAEVQPGDILILSAPENLRLYEYYFPLNLTQEGVAWRVLPGISGLSDDTYRVLEQLRSEHRRIWLVNAYEPIREWMQEEGFRVREAGFESPIAVLRAELYLPKRPITDEATIAHPTDILIGEDVRLRGYDVGQALASNQRVPITLYWQANGPIERRYKYVLQLVVKDADGRLHALPRTEREPFDGSLPTMEWPQGKIVTELTDAPGAPWPEGVEGRLYLALQMYDTETLEKLPVTALAGGETTDDGMTLLLSVPSGW